MSSFLYEYSAKDLALAFSADPPRSPKAELVKDDKTVREPSEAASGTANREMDVLLRSDTSVLERTKLELEQREISESDLNNVEKSSSRPSQKRPRNISAKDKEILAIGTTCKEAERREQITNSWSDGDAAQFRVRSLLYMKTKKKENSLPAFYEQIGMDLFQNTFDESTKIEHIAAHVDFRESNLKEYTPDCPLPRLLVFNVQVPVKAPRWVGKSDDPGVSLVLYYELKRSAFEEAMNLENASSAMKLVARFFHESQTNDDIRRRFKIIGLVHNFVDVKFPSMLQNYNGRPAIVFKTGEHFSNPEEEYYEIDINVHDFGVMARRGLSLVMEKVPQMQLQCGFIVQGESEEELPERILASTNVHWLDLKSATPVSIPSTELLKIQKRKTN